MSILKEIRDDPKYKKFKKIVISIREKLHVEKDRDEALALHASRTSRTLSGKGQFSLKALEEAALKDLGIRSRMVEIRVQVSYRMSLLEEAIDAIRGYIQTEFHDELSDFKTVEQRKQLVNRIVQSAIDTLVDCKHLIETLDHFIKDIDQASHSLRHAVETLKLLDSSKGKVV